MRCRSCTDAEPLYTIPDALLAEYGLQAGGATSRSYRFDEAAAVLVPVEPIRGPVIAPAA